MAIRKIVKDGDELLRKKSKPVVDFDDALAALLDDMFETMQKNEGAGLAGVQVGILKRLFVMKAGKERYDCINPTIVKQEEDDLNVGVEGCLSVPDKCGIVARPKKVWGQFQDRNGNTVNKKFTGFEARCYCHELDHLDGILYTDKATQMFKDRNEYIKYEQKKQKGVK